MSAVEKELKIQKAIKDTEDDLVKKIQEALDKCDYPKKGRDKLEEAQFRNLMLVAETTTSTEVIKNFLRYQMGRDKKWGQGQNALAEQIIKDIDDFLQKKANAIVDKNVDKDKFKIVWLDLIRRYLGYGSRYLKYLSSPNAPQINN